MKIEHMALNVAEPREMARWYADHLGMRVVRGDDCAPWIHFIADQSGMVMLELYRNGGGADTGLLGA